MNSKCNAKDPNNCRYHGTKNADRVNAKLERIAYLTTPEGIKELREQGKHELADKFEARRQRLEQEAERQARKSKKPLRLGLDVDETSGGFIHHLRLHVASKLGMSEAEAIEAFPDPTDYNLVKSGWFNDLDHFLTEFHEAEREGIYRKMRAFPGMSRTLRTLVANGDVEVHVVTAREAAWNEDTRYWLRKHRVPFTSITHTESKEAVENIDVFIDDSDKQLNTLRQHGRTVIAYHNRYNEHVETEHRVKGWDEVPSVIKLIAEKNLA